MKNKRAGFLLNAIVVIIIVIAILFIFMSTNSGYLDRAREIDKRFDCKYTCEVNDLEFYRYKDGVCECEVAPETIEVYKDGTR